MFWTSLEWQPLLEVFFSVIVTHSHISHVLFLVVLVNTNDLQSEFPPFLIKKIEHFLPKYINVINNIYYITINLMKCQPVDMSTTHKVMIIIVIWEKCNSTWKRNIQLHIPSEFTSIQQHLKRITIIVPLVESISYSDIKRLVLHQIICNFFLNFADYAYVFTRFMNMKLKINTKIRRCKLSLAQWYYHTYLKS